MIGRVRVERLDIPTVFRRAWEDPEPALGLLDKIEALWRGFLARVATGEIYWR